MTVPADVTKLIGNTPVVRLSRFRPGERAEIMAKLEWFNPGGSVKDRAALWMIKDAEEKGLLREGATIIEATSGNTGIALAMIAASRGYHLVLTMPESMSVERRQLLRAYGAQLVLTPAASGMRGAVEKALEIKERHPEYFMPFQFENPANPKAHESTTAVEILRATQGELDAFVAGVGTGGTITGVARVLKQVVPRVQVVAVEPAESSVLSGGKPGPHRIQGIGAGFVPKVLELSLVDQIVTVTSEEAFCTCRELAITEGLIAGISSGAALAAAVKVAQELGVGRRVLVMLPDGGERYLSVEGLFNKG
ncbi:MAG: cysteine synthase A [Bacillota bacterium]